MSALDVLAAILLVGLTAIPGALGIRLLAGSQPLTAVLGAALLIVAGVLPLLLAFGFAPAVFGLVLGGAAVALWRGRSSTWPKRAVLAVAVAWLAIEPLLLLTAFQIRSDETYSRCAADKAVAVVEASRSGGHGYPASIHDISEQDGSYGEGSCYVSNGVNWLYRVNNGSYALGYWVDWRVTRRVCIHHSGASGWTCGFEVWGPFRPGETD